MVGRLERLVIGPHHQLAARFGRRIRLVRLQWIAFFKDAVRRAIRLIRRNLVKTLMLVLAGGFQKHEDTVEIGADRRLQGRLWPGHCGFRRRKLTMASAFCARLLTRAASLMSP